MHHRYDPDFTVSVRSRKKPTKAALWKKARVKLLIFQEYKCSICCKEVKERPFLDHDHETGAIRGVLCCACNTGLGMFKDSPYILDKAIDYLIKALAKRTTGGINGNN